MCWWHPFHPFHPNWSLLVLKGATTAQCPYQPLFQFFGAWVGMGNFLPRDILDSPFLWGYVHFPSWNYVFPWTHDFCGLPLHLVCRLWAGKETFKWLEAAAGCKVTGADSGLAQAQSCKSAKCIAHNFLVPALLGSRALLGWMSSQHANPWIWCSFCLQGEWGLPLPRMPCSATGSPATWLLCSLSLLQP